MFQAVVGFKVAVIRNFPGSHEVQWEAAEKGTEVVKWPLIIAILSPLRL